jgi:hypothetical protein
VSFLNQYNTELRVLKEEETRSNDRVFCVIYLCAGNTTFRFSPDITSVRYTGADSRKFLGIFFYGDVFSSALLKQIELIFSRLGL